MIIYYETVNATEDNVDIGEFFNTPLLSNGMTYTPTLSFDKKRVLWKVENSDESLSEDLEKFEENIILTEKEYNSKLINY